MKNQTEFSRKILSFYDEHARELPFRVSPKPYYTWISEIMLQQTRMDTVIPYFNRFISTIPDIKTLAQVDDDLLMKLWEGLGYYSRARNLKKAAQIMVDRYQGELPDCFENLLTLPGIGPYTAGAIASIAFNKPVPAVDGNVIRVFSRLEAYGEPAMNAKGKRFIHTAVEKVISTERPGDFNQAVMELGATICLPNGAPLCEKCPVASHCLAFQAGNPLDFPIMPKKKERRIEKQTVLLVTNDSQFLVEERPEQGLLAGLLQFPMKSGHLEETEVKSWLEDMGYPDAQFKPGKSAKHIFSHVEWHMVSFDVTISSSRVRELSSNLRWVEAEDLEQITLPTAFKKFRQIMWSRLLDIV